LALSDSLFIAKAQHYIPATASAGMCFVFLYFKHHNKSRFLTSVKAIDPIA
jgi:penicillin-binding protein-related factor A (putative recombinase)